MLTRQAGDVAPWARQTCDQAGTDRVAETNEDDRDYCCDLFCRNCGRGSLGDNDIDLESDELSSDFAEAFVASLRPANLDCDGSVLDPAKLAHSLHKGGDPSALCRRYSAAYEPDGRELCRLLRAHREWPHHRRAAEQRDKLAPFHSITSSARASNAGGTSSPRARAVTRLMTNSNLVGCVTGRSAGLAPLST